MSIFQLLLELFSEPSACGDSSEMERLADGIYAYGDDLQKRFGAREKRKLGGDTVQLWCRCPQAWRMKCSGRCASSSLSEAKSGPGHQGP